MARRLNLLLAPVVIAVSGLCVSPRICADDLQDPTRPAGKSSPRSASVERRAPNVSAVFIARNSRLAIVNGTLVRAGDTLGDLHIDAILEDGIRYTRAGTASTSLLTRRPMMVRSPATVQARVGDKQQ